MKWLIDLIKNIFKKDKIKLIEEPKINNNIENRNDFKIILKQNTDLECDNRNGYKIIPKLRLKDMV